MKVAIIHDFLIKNGGAEKFLEALHAIYPDAPVYTLLYDEKGTKGRFSGQDYQIRTSYLQHYPSFLRHHSKYLLNSFPRAIEEFDLSEFDLVISSSNSFAHGVITKPSTLHICYCHSPIRYLWDWHHEYLIENSIGYGLGGILIRKMLSNLRLWDFYASPRVDVWIANSRNVQKRIKKFYRQESTIIHPASDISFGEISHKHKDYYLIISRLSKYKRIDLAVEAFNDNGKKLIIVGEGGEQEKLQQKAKSNISFYGYLPTNEVKKLIFDCKAFIFCGEEDFGLTPIEAMSAGKPVVAYGKGGVTESVIKGETGIFFNETTSKSLNQAIISLEDNYHKYSPDLCRARADLFSLKTFEHNISSFINDQYKIFKNE